MKKKEFRDLLVEESKAEIIIAGIPFDKNASVGKGASYTPKTLRKLSAHLPPFTKDGYSIKDVKLFDASDIKSKDFATIELKADELMNKEKINIFVGGDHSISIPLFKSFLKRCKRHKKIPALIHIDAHPDICDIYLNNKYSHACPVKRAIDNGLDSHNLVLIGIRGYEEQEVEYLKKHPEIDVYQASNLLKNGHQEMIDKILNKFNENYEIYLSYDIDANDPSFAPGTGTPEAFGLNANELMNSINDLIRKLNITAMDIVEVSPKLDNNNITSWLALKSLYEFFYTFINKRK